MVVLAAGVDGRLDFGLAALRGKNRTGGVLSVTVWCFCFPLPSGACF